jgi:hypothetical protein
MRAAVRDVAEHFPAAIVTGRCVDKVQSFVGLPELYYAGSHGMDIKGPSSNVRQQLSHSYRFIHTTTYPNRHHHHIRNHCFFCLLHTPLLFLYLLAATPPILQEEEDTKILLQPAREFLPVINKVIN